METRISFCDRRERTGTLVQQRLPKLLFSEALGDRMPLRYLPSDILKVLVSAPPSHLTMLNYTGGQGQKSGISFPLVDSPSHRKFHMKFTEACYGHQDSATV